jgi:Holliday junction resolvasome RuvABC endonuclease subunit
LIVFGVDAATSSGWAIVDSTAGKPRLVSYGVGCGTDHAVVHDLVENAQRLGAQLGAIEAPYVDKNPDTAIKLGVIVGRFAQELDRAGIAWTGHKAQQWQQRLLNGLIALTSPREVRKRAAIQWVKATYGIDAREDEADAICLTTWKAKEAHFEALKRKT